MANPEQFGRFLEEASVVEMVNGVKHVAKVYVRGDTVPTDGDKNYAKGCIFVKTDGTTLDDILYLNIGTAASCNFDAMVNS